MAFRKTPSVDPYDFLPGLAGIQAAGFNFSEREGCVVDTAPATDDLNPWLKKISPRFNWDPPHLLYLQARLEAMERGEISRLINEIPIRHGKSELGTIRYPIWRMTRKQDLRVCVVCNTATLAEKFGRKARSLAREAGIKLDESRTAVADWHTAAGGLLRAVGVGGTIIGEGFDLIIGDDLLKGREEAESEARREKAWEYFAGDLYGRLEPGGQIVLTMSRWHEEDPIGKCLAGGTGDTWERVHLPALAEENDPLGRAVDEPLWPERWSFDFLRRRRETNPYQFASQYQQRPAPPEGGMFRAGMIGKIVTPPAGLRWVRPWDLAATENDGDYTAGPKVGGPDADGIFYVIPRRFQHEPSRRNRIIRQTAVEDGVDVKILIPQDPGAAGKESAAALVRLLAGFNVATHVVSGKKETRAEPGAAQVNAGNVRVVTGGTPEGLKAATEFINELQNFPFGAYDDQVDAFADGLADLADPEWEWAW